MTNAPTNPAPDATASPEPSAMQQPAGRGRPPWWVIAAIGVGAAAVVALTVSLTWPSGGSAGWQTANVSEQGAVGTTYAANGAQLQRRSDGVAVTVDVPAPKPGSYEYPTNDMIPPWVDSHPLVSQGASEAPEAFTLWFFAFNDPTECTDGQCDNDDVGLDTGARGGVYQLDGRIAVDGMLRFAGNVRMGQLQLDGSPLDDPLAAEIHLAIAPHGRALPDDDGVIQLNNPVGNPTLWWGARFPAD